MNQEKLKGKVIEVFIPKEYKNNRLLDVMDRQNIGFKVLLDNKKEITIIKKQTNENANILREDRVLIININNDYDILKLDGE